jgi:hypothetical protein
VGSEVLVGEWTDGRAACEDRRRREKRGTDACTRSIPIRLAPLPCWAHLSTAEYQARCAQLIAEIEEESLATHPRALGAEAVLATEPLAHPEASPMTPRPGAHASCPSARRSLMSDNYFCRSTTTTSAGVADVRTAG